MSLTDIYSLEAEELAGIIESWADLRDRLYRDSWEQARFLAQCLLTPYSKKRIRPTDIIRFDWDGEKEKKAKRKEATPFAAADVERIRRMFGDG